MSYQERLREARHLSREQAGTPSTGLLTVTYGNAVCPITIFVTPDEWREHFERCESGWDYRFEYGMWPYI